MKYIAMMNGINRTVTFLRVRFSIAESLGGCWLTGGFTSDDM